MKRREGPKEICERSLIFKFPCQPKNKFKSWYMKGLNDVQQNGSDTCRFMPFQASEVSYWLCMCLLAMFLSILRGGKTLWANNSVLLEKVQRDEILFFWTSTILSVIPMKIKKIILYGFVLPSQLLLNYY